MDRPDMGPSSSFRDVGPFEELVQQIANLTARVETLEAPRVDIEQHGNESHVPSHAPPVSTVDTLPAGCPEMDADSHMRAAFEKWQRGVKGRTFQSLADATGVSRAFVHQCVKGSRLWPKGRIDDLPEQLRDGAVRDHIAKLEADLARFRQMLK